MATKKCPNCENDCPVASSSCKKCLHVFKSRKGSSNSFSSSSSGSQSGSAPQKDKDVNEETTQETVGNAGASEGQGRRHTGRITRSKPNFYDSLHVEEQMRQDTALKSHGTANRVFVTVGTTKFEDLVNAVQSSEVLAAFIAIGVKEIQVQMGNSATSEGRRKYENLQLEFFRYKSDIKEEIGLADVVISHAGAGTVLDVLSQRKRLIVVPNDRLMDNHQAELADYLAAKRYAFRSSIRSLAETVKSLSREESRVALPPAAPEAFDNFLKTRMRLSADGDSKLESVSRISLSRVLLCFGAIIAAVIAILNQLLV